ncbi:MAG: zinc metalloprotease [Melioribacteraceae bacterium]|nr:MAG: zinc metalloprotease [Melioribacteraceae bacterium]
MDYAFYFIVTILILVFIHELGHFLAAKISGMRVDVFAIGFGKRLFGYNKLTGFTVGDLPKDFDGQGNTDYRLSLLPLGGYVKIAGMVDESFDNDFVEKEPKPDEFRSKSTIAKLFVITAGVMMNLTLAILIFAGINFFQGRMIYDTNEIGVIPPNSIVAEAGFNTGDKILKVNEVPVSNWDELTTAILIEHLGSDLDILIDRNGNKVTVDLPSEFVQENSKESFFLPVGHTKPYIPSVMEDSPAEKAGLRADDVILSLNGVEINSHLEAIEIIKSNKNNEIPVMLLRGEDTVKTAVTPGYDGMIGIAIGHKYLGPYSFKSYGFFASFSQAITNIGQYTYLTLTMIKNVIVGKAEMSNTFGGPIKIAQFAADSADRGITSFLSFLAMLSLSLAILNMLPFPVLDGGHFVIILVEGIIKRELPVKVKIAIQNAGFFILLMLMALIIYNDILSL